MSILSDIRGFFRARRDEPEAAAVPVSAPVENLGQTPLPGFTYGSEPWAEMFGPVRALPFLTEYTAACSTAIYACVNLISGAISTLPAAMYRLDITNGEQDRIFHDDLLWVFNEQMTDRWLAPVGWEFLAKSILFEGDGFGIIKRDPLYRPIGLEPVHPYRVQNAVTAQKRMVYGIAPEMLPNGQVLGEFEIYDQDDIVHVPGFGFNGLRGMSPLRYSLREAGAVALAAQQYSARFFSNNARPDFALKTDQNLSPEKVGELEDKLDKRHREPQNAHKPMILAGGLDIKTWSINPEDMQLLATRQFQIEEIARAYGVPPFMIGHNEKTTSWGSGVEAMSIGFVRYTLAPYLNKFQTEINRKFFRTAARVMRFDTSELEQADTMTLYNALRVAVGRAGEPRIMTPDEARARLRLKKMGGDAAALGTNGGTGPAEPLPTSTPAKPKENAA